MNSHQSALCKAIRAVFGARGLLQRGQVHKLRNVEDHLPEGMKKTAGSASTGGWGFQAWPGGDPTKPIVNDSLKQCFACHVPKRANDYVFSTYLQ
jgi:hypothetical protein